ncbi:MAG: S8 family serine peptidase [Pseudomonadales bacterium]|nr:S8 family serine peptidase [Pseudomonadales bacterium]
MKFKSRRLIKIFAASLILVSYSLSAWGIDPVGKKRAVLIGAGDTPVEGLPRLYSTSNDVDLMATFLSGRHDFRDIVKIKGANATRANILAGIAKLAEVVEQGDITVVYYSGYGSQIPDENGDEADALDEVWLANDRKEVVSDDDLDEIFRQIWESSNKLTVIVDTCFSPVPAGGSANPKCLEIQANYKYQRKYSMQQSYRHVQANPWEERAAYPIYTASQVGGLAYETYSGGTEHGAFTYTLVRTLLDLKGARSIAEIESLVVPGVAERFPDQSPVFEVAGVGRRPAVFFDYDVASDFYISVSPDSANEGMFDIRGGTSVGIQQDHILDVYQSLGDAARTDPIAQLKVEQSEALFSKAFLVRGSIGGSAVAVLEDTRVDESISVWVDPSGFEDDGQLRKLRQVIQEHPDVLQIDQARGAQVLLHGSSDAGFWLSASDGSILSSRYSLDELPQAVFKRVMWLKTIGFSNADNATPSGLASLRVIVDDEKGEVLREKVPSGKFLRYTITNNHTEDIWVRSFLLSKSNIVEDKRVNKRLGFGESISEQLMTFVGDDNFSETDYIKVFVSTRKFRAKSILNLEPREEDFGRGEWGTLVKRFTVTQDQVRLVGFGAIGTPQRSLGRSQVCSESGRTCWRGNTISYEDGVTFLDTDLARTAPGAVSIGEAFDEAYDIQSELGLDKVEPLFEVAIDSEQHHVAQTRSGGEIENDPAAEANKRWSLEYVNAMRAWELLQETNSAVHGEEARGVHIAHLDTGYTEHPELVQEGSGPRTVLPEFGYNLVERDEDPSDRLDDGGFIPNPGHGTASGTAIVSPRECQKPNVHEPCVTGVGLGASLIPIRVHTSVVVLNQKKLAEAIYRVAENRVRGNPRIISIAMGGPPSWTLWRAVKKAEKNGYLTIAAAGNYVGLTVWPARFNSTIGVAAINIQCEPWSGSSFGSRIDFSAPGQSVWRGSADEENGFTIGMGTGTTFATATTTGVAALWVAKHRNSPAFRQLVKQGHVVRAFRAAANSATWRPTAEDTNRPEGVICADKEWRADWYGSGIIDAKRLLEAPLGSFESRSGLSDEDRLPLFRTLYDEGTEIDHIIEDYESLFKQAENSARFETEVLYHYSTNEVVRRALNRLARAGNEHGHLEFAAQTLRNADLSETLRKSLNE